MPNRRASSRPPIAVVDIGSNTSRITVFRFHGAHLETVGSTREVLRLVRDTEKRKKLGRKAIERTLTAFRDFRAVALGSGTRTVVALATSAMREAKNGPALIARIRRQLHFDVRLIDGAQEAYLGFLGAVHGLPVDHGLLFDLGGGSMQISHFRNRRIRRTWSFALGALRLSDRFLGSDPPSKRQIKKLARHVRETLEQARVPALRPDEALVGTGGTARNIAKIDRRTHPYPVPRLHGYALSLRAVRRIAARIVSRKQKDRAAIPGLKEDRADSVVGGTLAVAALMETLGAEMLQVSGQGVREGYAYRSLSPALPAVRQVRAASLAALTSRFRGWNARAAERRAGVAAALLRTLEPHPPADGAEALACAATLLDIGVTIDFFNRFDHVAAIVLGSDLGGFSHRAIAMIAAILRQAGNEKTDLKVFKPLLRSGEHRYVRRAAVLLKLADDIEARCRDGVRISVRCRRDEDGTMVTVPQLLGWRERPIHVRFEEVFGGRLLVERR